MELLVPQQINIELPENKYEQIVYLEDVAVKLNEFLLTLNNRVEELKTELTGDESDPKYHLVDVFDNRKTTVVDEDSLKADGLYNKCVSINGNNAMKLIGEERMMKYCMKDAGEERTLLACNVTLKQMKKVLTDEEFKKYTTEIYKKKGVAVAEKE